MRIGRRLCDSGAAILRGRWWLRSSAPRSLRAEAEALLLSPARSCRRPRGRPGTAWAKSGSPQPIHHSSRPSRSSFAVAPGSLCPPPSSVGPASAGTASSSSSSSFRRRRRRLFLLLLSPPPFPHSPPRGAELDYGDQVGAEQRQSGRPGHRVPCGRDGGAPRLRGFILTWLLSVLPAPPPPPPPPLLLLRPPAAGSERATVPGSRRSLSVSCLIGGKLWEGFLFFRLFLFSVVFFPFSPDREGGGILFLPRLLNLVRRIC